MEGVYPKKGENLRCLDKNRIIHQIKQPGSWRPLSITTYKWGQASFDIFQCDLCCTLLSLSSIKRSTCTCFLPSFSEWSLVNSSCQYPLWTQWISLSKNDGKERYTTHNSCHQNQKWRNPIDFDVSVRFPRPPSACWHKDVQPRLFDPIHSAGNEFEPNVVFVSPHSHHLLQHLLPFPMLFTSGPWESWDWLLPTMMPVKPPDMTNKCPAPTK